MTVSPTASPSSMAVTLLPRRPGRRGQAGDHRFRGGGRGNGDHRAARPRRRRRRAARPGRRAPVAFRGPSASASRCAAAGAADSYAQAGYGGQGRALPVCIHRSAYGLQSVVYVDKRWAGGQEDHTGASPCPRLTRRLQGCPTACAPIPLPSCPLCPLWLLCSSKPPLLSAGFGRRAREDRHT
jgi:hypothetical protein